MESMTGAPDRSRRPALIVAACGAVLLLLPFGGLVRIGGVVLALIGTLFSTPADHDIARTGWWRLLATGAAISILAPLLALFWATGASVVAAVAGGLALVAVCFGWT